MKRRRLADLYVKGKDLVFEAGTEDEVRVYLRKLNEVEVEKVSRRANAAKALSLMTRSDKTSDDYLSAVAEVDRIGGKDEWVDYLAEAEVMKNSMKIEAELAEEDEWKKDEYLQGLYDQWTETLSVKHFTEPDEESERVWVELQRYNTQLQERINADKQRYVAEYAEIDEEKLHDKMIKNLIDRRADFAWMKALRRAEIFIATRDADDKKTPYFENFAEVEELPDDLFLRLVSEYQSISVDVVEGKDLPPTQDSSPPSEQPEEPVMADSSGPQEAPL